MDKIYCIAKTEIWFIGTDSIVRRFYCSFIEIMDSSNSHINGRNDTNSERNMVLERRNTMDTMMTEDIDMNSINCKFK